MDTISKIRVYNRSNSSVFYKDEETGKTRVWEPAINGVETYKDLTFDEIQRVVNSRGGKILFEEYLTIKDKAICDELDIKCPKEYFYDIKEITKILQSGTDFELVEMLENAPEGVKDSVKQIAIEIRLDSSRKRDIIKRLLNFDVNFAINNDIEFKDKIVEDKKNETKPPKYIVTQQ